MVPAHKCSGFWRRWALGAVLACFALPSLPRIAWATPAKAQQLGAQAKKAYDENQFERATELYLAAAREDEAAVAFVYAAARSAHKAGRLDQAEELYRKALKTGRLSADIAEKATAQLDAIATKRAETLDAEAEKLQQAGQYAAAADAWRSAAAAQPKRAVYWCRAGRAARLAGNVPQATGDYRFCRDKAEAGAPERADAERVLAEIAAPAVVEKGGIAIQSAEGPDKTGAWVATAGAGAGLVAGAALLYLGSAASAEANGLPVKSKDDIARYNTAFDRAELFWRGGAVAAGLGVLGGGVAAWLHLRGGSARVAVVPGVNGVGVAVRF